MKNGVSLPRKWVKILVDAVYQDKAGRRLANCDSYRKYYGITVVLPDGSKWRSTSIHAGSFYFEGLRKRGDAELRVSTHWVNPKSKKLDNYKGDGCIPYIIGKCETYKGFAAACTKLF